jgi:hypothetical protein
MRYGLQEVAGDDSPSLADQYNIKDYVSERLLNMGILPRARPSIEKTHEPIFPGMQEGDQFDGRLPTVVRNLTLDQLSGLHFLMASWFGYVSYQQHLISSELSEASHRREFIKAGLRSDVAKQSDKAVTEKFKSDEATKNPVFVEADSLFAKLEQLYEAIKAVVSVAEQDLKMVSREITVKQIEIEQAMFRGRHAGPSGRYDPAARRG